MWSLIGPGTYASSRVLCRSSLGAGTAARHLFIEVNGLDRASCPRCLRPYADHRVLWSQQVVTKPMQLRPEDQEHQADRPRIPQLHPLPAATVAQPRAHPRRSLTDTDQNPRSQVHCIEPAMLEMGGAVREFSRLIRRHGDHHSCGYSPTACAKVKNRSGSYRRLTCCSRP